MDLMNLQKSIEERLYELVAWLLLYLLTLWKCVRHPIRMMAYADAELGSDAKTRYATAISPPIFLFLTLLLAHLVDLRFACSSACSGMSERIVRTTILGCAAWCAEQ